MWPRLERSPRRGRLHVQVVLVVVEVLVVEEVRMAWKEDIAPAAKHGGDRASGVTPLECPDHRTADGILRRLKRDHPDLAQSVIDGTTTATAGS